MSAPPKGEEREETLERQRDTITETDECRLTPGEWQAKQALDIGIYLGVLEREKPEELAKYVRMFACTLYLTRDSVCRAEHDYSVLSHYGRSFHSFCGFQRFGDMSASEHVILFAQGILRVFAILVVHRHRCIDVHDVLWRDDVADRIDLLLDFLFEESKSGVLNWSLAHTASTHSRTAGCGTRGSQ